jgi:hypothetical protein
MSINVVPVGGPTSPYCNGCIAEHTLGYYTASKQGLYPLNTMAVYRKLCPFILQAVEWPHIRLLQ